MPDLLADYTAQSEQLMPFYARAAQAVLAPPYPDGRMSAALADEINQYQQRLGGEGTLQGDELFILTGQQPGLFTGPLYTVYKAATAILLAARAERATGRRCVPVFWVASDDHDFEEVREAHFLTRRHDRLTLRYTPEETLALALGEIPMHRVPATPQIHQFIDLARKFCPGSELAAQVAEGLHDAANEAESVSDWFARLMARLFAGTPLHLFSPDLPGARRAAAPVFQHEAAEPLASTRLLNETGKALEALGYPAQVVKGGRQCNFFLEVNGKRRTVWFQNGRFMVPRETAQFSPDEMQALADTAPERFSANVALRCVVQQALFPGTLAYVAGPGELAYWAQLKRFFTHFGQPMPVVYPRARAVVIAQKERQLLDRFGLSAGQMDAPRDVLEERAARAVAANPAIALVHQERSTLEHELASLAERLADSRGANETARQAALGIRDHLARGFDRLERHLLHNDTEKYSAAARQVDRLCTALAPERKPQERVYCVYSFIFAEGGAFIDKVLDQLDITSFALNEVRL